MDDIRILENNLEAREQREEAKENQNKGRNSEKKVVLKMPKRSKKTEA